MEGVSAFSFTVPAKQITAAETALSVDFETYFFLFLRVLVDNTTAL
jgi:hypothetical protein